MKDKLLIKGGRVISPEDKVDAVCDLLVEDGKVAKLGTNIEARGAKVIDAKGKVLTPGLIDLHAHLRQPGREDEETFVSAGRAAARGGFTAVCAMPNTEPASDNEETIKFVLNRANKESAVKVNAIGAITKGRQGRELAPMGELKDAGAVALSDDGNPLEDANVMRRAMEYCRMVGLVIISHCEVRSLSGKGVINEGFISTVLGLPGIPRESEVIAVGRDLELAKLTGCRLHIAHISCAGSVAAVRRAKKEGVLVTAETCPHYFALTDDALKTFDTNAKINPPLRSGEDVEAIKEGLREGVIDAIATDHAPHSENEKEFEFTLAPFGTTGLETALAVGITELVNKKVLTLTQLIEKMSPNPSRILNLEGGNLSPGSPADITIIDLEKEWTPRKDDFLSLSKNSCFIGRKLKGVVSAAICRGKIVYEAT